MASDVRYRLSAEGVNDVVQAFKKIQAEAEATARKSRGPFASLNGILGQSQRLLGGLGIAVGVAGFTALARAAAESADALQENAEAIGTTTTRLSALGTIAKLNGGDIDLLRESLGRLAVRVQDLRDGSASAVGPFSRLGLTAKQFNGKDTAQQFELVAAALAKLPNGAEKTATAIDLLGRRGAKLIPIMNALSQAGGLGGAEAAARRLGLVLDDDVVAAAARVADEMELITQAVNAATTQFVAGLSPAIHQTFEVLTGDLARGQEGFRSFGEFVGLLVRGINFLLALVGQLIDDAQTAVTLVGSILGTLSAGLALIVTGNADRLPTLWRNTLTAIERITREFNDRAKAREEALFNPAPPPQIPAAGAGGTGTPDPAAAAAKAAAAFAKRLAATKALLDSELKTVQLQLRLQREAEDRRFSEGLTSVTQHYARRREIATQALAAEIRALEARRRVEAQNPDAAAALAAVREVDAEINRLRLAGKGQIAELLQDEAEAARRVGAEKIKATEDLLAAEGRAHEVRMQRIGAEAAELDRVLAQAGTPRAEIDRQLADLQKLRQAEAVFDDVVARFEATLAALQAAKDGVARNIAAALISEAAGERQILALERERIPVLEELAALALEIATATNDPERIAQAQRLNAEILALGISATEAQRMLANLDAELEGLVTGALTDFLSLGQDGFGDLKTKALQAISSIIIGLQRLLAQLIAMQAFKALLGLVSGVPSTSIASNPGVPLPEFAGGGPLDVTAGGRLRGPGTRTSDSLLLRGSTDEFMIQAAAATRPGAHQLLTGINDLSLDPIELLTAARMREIRGYADGGPIVTGGAGGAGGTGASGTLELGGRLEVALGEGLVAGELKTRAGTRALLQVLAANPSAARAALGIGGK